MALVKPSNKPSNPNFSSGPCAKRPGWELSVLKNTPIGDRIDQKNVKKSLIKQLLNRNKF